MMIQAKFVLPFLAFGAANVFADQELLERKMHRNLDSTVSSEDMESLFHESNRGLSDGSYSMSMLYRKRHQRRHLARNDPYATVGDEELNLFASTEGDRILADYNSMSMDHKKGKRTLAATNKNHAATKDPYAFFEGDENEATLFADDGRILSESYSMSLGYRNRKHMRKLAPAAPAVPVRANDPYAFFEGDEDGEMALFGEDAGRDLSESYSMSMVVDKYHRRQLKTNAAPVGLEDALFEEDFRLLSSTGSYSMPKSSKKDKDACGVTCRSSKQCDDTCPVCHKASKHDKTGKCVKETGKKSVTKDTVKSKKVSKKEDESTCNKRCKYDTDCGTDCSMCHKENTHVKYGTCVSESSGGGGGESNCHCKRGKKYCHVCTTKYGKKKCEYQMKGSCKDDTKEKDNKKKNNKKKYNKKKYNKKNNNKGKDNKWKGW